MPEFLKELSRRNVFRVAAAYVIVGWIVLQVVGLMAPSLGLPDWTLALIFVILLSAFPIAIFLTWAFEMTPDGVKKSESNGEVASAGMNKADIGLISIGGLVIAVGLLAPPGRAPGDGTEELRQSVEDGSDGGAPSFSLAVLPFENFSDNKQLGWAADGIAEDILTDMSNLPRISLAARNSSFQFKGQNKDIREIGEILGVRYVLEGSLREQGEDLRITAQLIEAESGNHVWSGQFNPSMKERAELHDSVIDEILAEVSSNIRATEYERLARIPEDNLSGRDLGLLAESFLFGGNLTEALRLADKAIAVDPKQVHARVTRGLCLNFRRAFAATSAEKDQIKRLILDEISVLKSLSKRSFTYLGIATLLVEIGERETALFYANQEKELAPDYSGVYATLALIHVRSGKYEAALNFVDTCLEKTNNHGVLVSSCYLHQADAFYSLGRFEEALASADVALNYSSGNVPASRVVGLAALMSLGRVDEVVSRLAKWPEMGRAIKMVDFEFSFRELYADQVLVENRISTFQALVEIVEGMEE